MITQTEGYIYSIWCDGTYWRNVGYVEAQQILGELGLSTSGAIDFLERVGGPEDLALEYAGITAMNVTDLTGDPA